jgi:hypothetical protein
MLAAATHTSLYDTHHHARLRAPLARLGLPLACVRVCVWCVYIKENRCKSVMVPVISENDQSQLRAHILHHR